MVTLHSNIKTYVICIILVAPYDITRRDRGVWERNVISIGLMLERYWN